MHKKSLVCTLNLFGRADCNDTIVQTVGEERNRRTYCEKRVHNDKNAGLHRVQGNVDLILKIGGNGETDLIKIVPRL